MHIVEETRLTIALTNGTTIVLNNDSIISLNLSAQAVSGNTFELGSVCSRTLTGQIEIKDTNRYALIGATILLAYKTDDEFKQKGVFYITSSSRYKNMITFSASDGMILLSQPSYFIDENNKQVGTIYNYLKSQRTIYQVLKYIVEDIGGLVLAHTEQEVINMPNGEFYTICFQEVRNLIPRDWLSWVAEFLCGFAIINEYGFVEIKRFGRLPTATITKEMIQADTTDVADFELLVTGVSMNEVWNGTYGVWWRTGREGKPNCFYIDVSDNQLIQGKHYLYAYPGGGYAMDVLQNIFNAISWWDDVEKADSVVIRPFTATVHTSQNLYVGQCILIEDTDGNLQRTIITHLSKSLDAGYQIKCIGEDTRFNTDNYIRTRIKRENDKLRSVIDNMGIDIATEEELKALDDAGKTIEGRTYYIPFDEDEEENG